MSAPIGIFDSGIGGLMVARAVTSLLPDENIIYYGDTAHLPYGDKSGDAIRYYSLKIVKFLLEQGCKMIVIACNSASSAAYDVLLEFYAEQTLFVNVVDPLVDAVARSSARKAGIIATKATVSSGVYERELKAKAPHIAVSSLATPLLVPMIEEGYFNNSISEAIIHNYLSRPELKDIDALLLACTHYPLIRDVINVYYSGGVSIYDSNDVVAQTVKEKLITHNLRHNSRDNGHRFYVSDYTPSFEATTRIFYGRDIDLEQKNIW